MNIRPSESTSKESGLKNASFSLSDPILTVVQFLWDSLKFLDEPFGNKYFWRRRLGSKMS